MKLAIPCTGLIALFAATLGGEIPRNHPAAHFHVSPAGSPSGAGSAARPWDLATALAGARGRVRPGDTVWIHGGRYRGAFKTTLIADSARPIVFRQAPGERATIDGTLKADGAYLTFWGFEIMQSVPTTYGLEARTIGGKFINLVIHDAGTMGVSFWTPGENAELYGCIVYRNGTHENLDHGVYVHNERGTKLLADNVFFDNLAYGIHVYAGARNPPQRGVRVQGNIAFNNGTISRRYRAKGNILVGGEVPMSDMQVVDNLVYFAGPDGENIRLGYASVTNGDIVARGNVAWGGEVGLRVGNWQAAVVEGNTLVGARQLVSGLAPDRSNALYARPRTPPAPAVFVKPNRYEPGRGYVVIYNWQQLPSVKVDLSTVLTEGQTYELRRVQDVFGAPVARGTFAGDSVALPASAFDVYLVTVSAPASVAAPSGRSRSRAQ